MTPAGFPHSDIHGSLPACGSPWLFAACHVLLRRMVPWHPPCALISLIFSSLFVLRPIVLSLLYHFILHPFQNEELSLQLAFSVQIFSCCAVVKVQGAFHTSFPLPLGRIRFVFPASGIQSFDQTLKTIQSSKRNRQLTCMTHVFHVHARAPTLSCCSCSASVSG